MRSPLVACVLSLGICAAAADAQTLNTDQDKTLYALGVAIGGQVKESVKTFNLTPAEFALVNAGLSDAVAGKEAKVDMQTFGPKIQALAQERTASAATNEKKASGAFLEKMSKEPGAVRGASGVIYIPVTVGTGASPKAENTVKVHYHGTLRDGTVFDSSVQRGEPISFPLNRVIPCWTEGVQKMKVGGKAKLVCPSETAYGDNGQGPIPGGAALMFEVELLGIEP
ncbi:MAG TPA: FKBP-type peptidyl-prolyl cis-trans isomerase [Gammaproteobacteria bacterium]|nr:FKBP-type peptidyl-prolyl cis-trans isomerase [Gammaproteobacteria bacterium]